VVGAAKAKELVYTTNRVKAQEALDLGLVSSIYPADGLMDAANQMAEKIAANAPVGIRAVKRIANDSIGLSIKDAVNLEAKLFAACFATADQKRAMTAFLEKRKPEPFEGK
jgi:enoyl-CoA hydratase